MIIEVTESVYKGILVEHVDGKGWKCNLGGTEYLFPNYTAAEAAIDEIFQDIKPVVAKRKGVKMKMQFELADPIPQCDNCERLAEITASFIKHLQAEEQYLDDILVTLELQKDAFEDKNYQQAEKLLDELIADLKTSEKA
jgi:hypothetical protein